LAVLECFVKDKEKITFSTKNYNDFEIPKTKNDYEVSTISVNTYKSIDFRLCVAVIYRNTIFTE